MNLRIHLIIIKLLFGNIFRNPVLSGKKQVCILTGVTVVLQVLTLCTSGGGATPEGSTKRCQVFL